MVEQHDDEALAHLRERARLQEHQFSSRVPLIGSVIAAFRSAWNNISKRWYVAPVLQQQSEFNLLTVERLAQVAARLDSQAEQLIALQDLLTKLALPVTEQLNDVQEWLIAQDREQTEIRHDLGELDLRVGQLVRLEKDAGLEPVQPSSTDPGKGAA